MMRLALCNEVIRERDFAEQCDLAASLGYEALELAPFTLADEPHRLDGAARASLRRAALDAGIAISGLHWLLVKPEGLSITSSDDLVRQRTIEVIRGLVYLCAELGGSVVVHGSPAQRALEPGQEVDGVKRALDCFEAAAEAAHQAGVTYCLEPLAPAETPFINTVAEAARIVEAVGSPAFRTMIDCCAARQAESEDVPDLLDRWLPAGTIAHVHLNDRNRQGPGQGGDHFAAVLASLKGHGYEGTVAVEPFVYEPDGPTCAARAAGYVRGILEALP